MNNSYDELKHKTRIKKVSKTEKISNRSLKWSIILNDDLIDDRNYFEVAKCFKSNYPAKLIAYYIICIIYSEQNLINYYFLKGRYLKTDIWPFNPIQFTLTTYTRTQ